MSSFSLYRLAASSISRTLWRPFFGLGTGLACLAFALGGYTRYRPCSVDDARHDSIAFSQLADQHLLPGRACPRSLSQVTQHRQNTRDPWGTPYEHACTEAGIVVCSAGEDRRFATADDVCSDGSFP